MTFTLFSGRAMRGCVGTAMVACGLAHDTALLNSSYDVACELFATLSFGFIAKIAARIPTTR